MGLPASGRHYRVQKTRAVASAGFLLRAWMWAAPTNGRCLPPSRGFPVNAEPDADRINANAGTDRVNACAGTDRVNANVGTDR
ncbi:hypothetical protein [Stenotrophomonas rhizophila]